MSVVAVAKLDKETLEKMLAQYEREIAKAYRTVIESIKDQVTLKELERIIREGDYPSFERVVSAAVDKMASDIQVLFVEAGRFAAAAATAELGVVISFNAGSPAAINHLQQYKLDLIREVTQPQVEAVRTAGLRALNEGLNPRTVARDLRSTIGLTTKQRQQVANFRASLEDLDGRHKQYTLRDRRFDRTINNAIKGEKPLTQAQIDKMVERYTQRRIKARTETIARTEALRSLNQGLHDGIQDAVNSGSISADSLVRRWNTARDERVRGSHSDMQGQLRAVGEAFRSGNGFSLAYPGDTNAPGSETINCRCVVTTTFKKPEKKASE